MGFRAQGGEGAIGYANVASAIKFNAEGGQGPSYLAELYVEAADLLRDVFLDFCVVVDLEVLLFANGPDLPPSGFDDGKRRRAPAKSCTQ